MRLLAFSILFASLLLISASPPALAEVPPATAAAKLFPDKIKDFTAVGPARTQKELASNDFNETAEATREYRIDGGSRLSVTVVTTASDASAYALLTSIASAHPRNKTKADVAPEKPQPAGVGTVSYLFSDCVFFYKGSTYVVVGQMEHRGKDQEKLLSLARGFADLLPGEGEIPPLVKHLPNWESKILDAGYAVNQKTLARLVDNQPALESIGFDGGTEAVAAHYGPSQLLIVEFTTPQLASDNDRRFTGKIGELKASGKTTPSAYRRIGNYSAFVFNAPDSETANQLLNQISYEQVVQWLGDNPNLLKEAERRYAETTLGVFVSVVKASGLAAILCFGIGGFLGALLFARRRAQQSDQRAYSDAGGMMRLNIDEMTPQVDPGRLIGSGDH